MVFKMKKTILMFIVMVFVTFNIFSDEFFSGLYNKFFLNGYSIDFFKNFPKKEISYINDGSQWLKDNEIIYHYNFDKEGKVKKIVYQDDSSQLSREINFLYDENNRVILYERKTVSTETKGLASTHKIVVEYLKNQIKETYYDYGKIYNIITYKLNSNGSVYEIESKNYRKGSMKLNFVCFITYLKDEKKIKKIEKKLFYYDETKIRSTNTIIKEFEYSPKKYIIKFDRERVDEIFLDNDGDIILIMQHTPYGEFKRTKTEISYDKHKRIIEHLNLCEYTNEFSRRQNTASDRKYVYEY